MKTPTNNIPSIGPLYADDLQSEVTKILKAKSKRKF